MGGQAEQASEGNDKTNIDFQQSTGPYAASTFERNYWDPNSQAGQAQSGFVNRQMQDVANKYGAKGAEVSQGLADQGINNGTIGQFAQSQRVDQPRAQEQSAILNNQFNQNWAGEQGQVGRQADYTQQLNDLAYKKAAGEQQAEFNARQNQLQSRQTNQLASNAGNVELAKSVMGGMQKAASAGG